MWGLAKLANEQKEDKASVWPALGLAGLGGAAGAVAGPELMKKQMIEQARKAGQTAEDIVSRQYEPILNPLQEHVNVTERQYLAKMREAESAFGPEMDRTTALRNQHFHNLIQARKSGHSPRDLEEAYERHDNNYWDLEKRKEQFYANDKKMHEAAKDRLHEAKMNRYEEMGEKYREAYHQTRDNSYKRYRNIGGLAGAGLGLGAYGLYRAMKPTEQGE